MLGLPDGKFEIQVDGKQLKPGDVLDPHKVFQIVTSRTDHRFLVKVIPIGLDESQSTFQRDVTISGDNCTTAGLLAAAGLDASLQATAGGKTLSQTADLRQLSEGSVVCVFYPLPQAGVKYTVKMISGETRPLLSKGPAKVIDAKLWILKTTNHHRTLPGVLALQFWNVELEDAADLLSCRIPDGQTIDIIPRKRSTISVNLDGPQDYYFAAHEVLQSLALVIAKELPGEVSPSSISFVRGNRTLGHSELIISFADAPLDVVVATEFVFDGPSGELKVSLPKGATIADARAALAVRLATRGDLLEFWVGDAAVEDPSKPIESFRQRLSITCLKPTIFVYERQEYPIAIAIDLEFRDVVKQVAAALPGSISPDSLVITFQNAVVDMDMAIRDLDPDEDTRLVVELKEPDDTGEPQPRAAGQELTRASSPPVIPPAPPVQPVVSRVASARPAQSAPPASQPPTLLPGMASEVQPSWHATGPVTASGRQQPLPPASVAPRSPPRPAPPQAAILNLGVPPAAAALRAAAPNPVHAASRPAPAPPAAAAPKPAAVAGGVKINFKVPERGDDFVFELGFPKGAIADDAARRVAEYLEVATEAVMLFISGKSLQAQFPLDRLRDGRQVITVRLRSAAYITDVTAEAAGEPPV
jgi:hypothetical protein